MLCNSPNFALFPPLSLSLSWLSNVNCQEPKLETIHTTKTNKGLAVRAVQNKTHNDYKLKRPCVCVWVGRGEKKKKEAAPHSHTKLLYVAGPALLSYVNTVRCTATEEFVGFKNNILNLPNRIF